MIRKSLLVLGALFLTVFSTLAQEDQETPQEGHVNENKFRQLYDEFATPNAYRTASGAPGYKYYQQRADYKMDITLDDANKKLYGEETITYTNNSPDVLQYLWVQLDQNKRALDSKTPLIEGEGAPIAEIPEAFVANYMGEDFDGGFKITSVKKTGGSSLQYTINQTMMRIDLPTPLKSGEQFSFDIKWWYNINDHVAHRDRSGYEYFPKDGNRLYVIAQFYPRMCVYNDVEGWQNYQFWGGGEFALPFGDFEVNITTPSDHILDATGVLQNRKQVFTKPMMQRYAEAKKSYDKPVLIVTQEEAEQAEQGFATDTKTWEFVAKNVRDFGFASSRKFIYDMQAVKIGGKDVMAVSMYPKEGNPLWEEYSTKTVAHSLKTYSKYTFDYPYHKAISVHSKNQGMEYPMICWNYGRPSEDGSYSDRTKHGMISVIIHEIGHNFFPMIVNSDERQWGWMDEGLNTFMQYVTEQELDLGYEYPSRRGPAKKIIPYMGGDQTTIAPIMSNPENIHQLGPNAYGKPATALNILREVVMGKELFDFAFQTYSKRWMFKHPTPEDFFRTMEDASAVDLDWFWRGWFYTTDYVDMGVKEVRKNYVSSRPNDEILKIMDQRGLKETDLRPLVFLMSEEDKNFKEELKGRSIFENSRQLKGYMESNFTAEEITAYEEKAPKYFYEVVFEKPGGLVMPLHVRYTYDDGTTEFVKYPAQIWRKGDKECMKLIPSDKVITKIEVDPNETMADIDMSNNVWPREAVDGSSEFEEFKNKQ